MKRKNYGILTAFLAGLTAFSCLPRPGTPVLEKGALPPDFCYVDEVAPAIRADLKYAGHDNFVGRPIEGYQGRRAILRKDAAEALARASAALAERGLGLLIWDAYRPSSSMLDFYRWSQTEDDRTRAEFYPHLTKKGIYEGKYIGLVSEHSWGIAVDITLVDLKTGTPLDMGGRHDFLDPSSATAYAGLTPRRKLNRNLLLTVLESYGFRNYDKEWWHFFYRSDRPLYSYAFPVKDDYRTL